MLSRFADARIVAVDDTPANLSLIEAVLRRAGLQHVHTVSDSREALGVLADVRPDLVLLDLHMPHVSGFELLEEIVRRASGEYLPVLVLSADTTPDAAHRALAAGARDFLVKPFDLTDVLLRVGNLLETRALHQQLRRVSRRLTGELSEIRRREADRTAARETIRAGVADVLSEGGPRVVLQPIVDIVTDSVCGYEALARFDAGCPRSPARWFADATEVGLGPELELAAVGRAMDLLPQLPPGAHLAVNVSPETLLRPGLERLIPVDEGHRIVLELTEHQPVEDYAPVLRALAPLRDRGVRLAVDDTGAGFASLRHILALQPDVIKLDLTLVRDIDVDPARRALAAALVSFALETGLRVVAEGVETAAELAALRGLGVRCAQGFYLGEPSEVPVAVGLATRAEPLPSPSPGLAGGARATGRPPAG